MCIRDRPSDLIPLAPPDHRRKFRVLDLRRFRSPGHKHSAKRPAPRRRATNAQNGVLAVQGRLKLLPS
eukprot:12230717-Alexandrium_andersonii.AAC.1